MICGFVGGGVLGPDTRKIRRLRKEWQLLGRGRAPGNIVGAQGGHARKLVEHFARSGDSTWLKRKRHV